MSRSKTRKSKSKSGLSQTAPTSPRKPLTLVSSADEAELLRRLWNFNAHLREAREVEKVLSQALRMGLEFFRADGGCVVTMRRGRTEAEILFAVPDDDSWDRDLLARFLGGEKVEVPPHVMLSRMRRYGRGWGALVLRSPGADFGWEARHAFSTIGQVATQLMERIDEQRIREVRARIDQKVLEQIGPKDLSYQILHGIRSLVSYDHSAALLTCDEGRTSLEIVGEQIAWRKAKSQLVGRKLPLPKPLLELLSRNVVFGLDRSGKGWTDWTQSEGAPLAAMLDYNGDGLSGPLSTAEGALLCAPLVTRHGVLGVLKVAAAQPGSFGAYEADVISQFLPQVAVALQNMRRTETLEQRMRTAERKQAMADLARGVAHDVNNALGAVLPLVQQLQDDLASGPLDAESTADDLRQIERSMQVCRRIFGGMLAFARNAARSAGDIYLHREVEYTLAIFKESLQMHGIDVATDVPADLPPLRGIQADVAQVLLNLIANARDAMQGNGGQHAGKPGGRLTIRAKRNGERVELTVQDTGCGIPPEDMARIQEPFFTTKPTGNGLGLSICRSIVSQMSGSLRLESRPGHGTLVTVSLPCAREAEGIRD